MNKLAKAAALTVLVGGMGLVGTAAHAGDFGNDDPGTNAQFVHCGQDFDAGLAFAPITGAVTGNNNEHIGNFCTVIGTPR
ncbi:hypothetical protein [Streptomyces anandii]|uniref:hypothetical protein n=1 Tax=Streptomyces anandii TaxID=285454 RepID=UPI00379205E5